MARIETDPNYSSPTFSRATAATDLFKKEDVQNLAAAMSAHDHNVNKGLAVTRLGTLNQDVTWGTAGTGIKSDSFVFQPVSLNTNPIVSLVPNGSGTQSSINLYASPTTGQSLVGQINASPTALSIISTRNGAAAFGVIDFYTSATSRMTIQVDGTINLKGQVQVGSAGFFSASNLDVTGSIIMSGVLYMNNATGIVMKDQGAVQRNVITMNGNYCDLSVAGGLQLRVLNQARSVALFTIDNNATVCSITSAGLNVGSNIAFGANLACLMFNDNAGAGTTYNRSGTGVHYFQRTSDGAWGTLNAASFAVQPSAAAAKTNVQPLNDSLSLVTDTTLHGVSYELIDTGEQFIGFVADPWHRRAPELNLVNLDAEGGVSGMDYMRVGAITFEALKQYIEQTDARLAALEERIAA